MMGSGTPGLEQVPGLVDVGVVRRPGRRAGSRRAAVPNCSGVLRPATPRWPARGARARRDVLPVLVEAAVAPDPAGDQRLRVVVRGEQLRLGVVELRRAHRHLPWVDPKCKLSCIHLARVTRHSGTVLPAVRRTYADHRQTCLGCADSQLRAPERRLDPAGGRVRLRARGLAATSMDDVAAEAGVTRLIVYRNFESKEGLYRAVLERVATRLRDEFVAGLERLRAGVRRAVAAHRRPGGPRRVPPAVGARRPRAGVRRATPASTALARSTPPTNSSAARSPTRPSAAGPPTRWWGCSSSPYWRGSTKATRSGTPSS